MSAPGDRGGKLRKRSLSILISTLVGLGVMASPAEAATPHEIEIDGSPLFSRFFVVLGATGWLPADSVQSVQLNEGRRYQIRTAALPADFTFWVDSAGRVDYDPHAESFLDGAGTSRLTMVGVDTTIDARYLSGSGVLISHAPPNNEDWLRHRTVRLLPGPVYTWQQGSGVVVNFRAALQRDGRWSYDEHYDLASGGYVSGNGTSTLTFFGRTLLVDGRAAGGVGVLVHNVWGLPFSFSGVQTVVLLPASTFTLQVHGHELSRAVFTMHDSGDIAFDPSLPLTVDRFDGIRRLTVTNPL